jgi:flagellar basal-body rod modification protein FlgD
MNMQMDRALQALTAGTASKTDASKSAGGQQSRFLSLLVAQMQNQDPLNPMDNAQLTTQLAQISAVDGIERLNATMASLIGQFGGMQTLQGAALAGRDVLVAGNALRLENGAATAGFQLDGPVEQVAITILDANGTAVHRAELGPHAAGIHSFQWDGATDSGAAAASGNYTFAVKALAQGKEAAATALAAARVEGVSRAEDGLTLNLRGLGAKALADVKQIM